MTEILTVLSQSSEVSSGVGKSRVVESFSKIAKFDSSCASSRYYGLSSLLVNIPPKVSFSLSSCQRLSVSDHTLHNVYFLIPDNMPATNPIIAQAVEAMEEQIRSLPSGDASDAAFESWGKEVAIRMVRGYIFRSIRFR